MGTAPVVGESISTTVYGRGEPLEWMKPAPSSNVVPKTVSPAGVPASTLQQWLNTSHEVPPWVTHPAG